LSLHHGSQSLIASLALASVHEAKSPIDTIPVNNALRDSLASYSARNAGQHYPVKNRSQFVNNLMRIFCDHFDGRGPNLKGGMRLSTQNFLVDTANKRI
jgi:hypothetical protein